MELPTNEKKDTIDTTTARFFYAMRPSNALSLMQYYVKGLQQRIPNGERHKLLELMTAKKLDGLEMNSGDLVLSSDTVDEGNIKHWEQCGLNALRFLEARYARGEAHRVPNGVRHTALRIILARRLLIGED